uniref:Uncharacterized protein n=1 Tax=Chenopodium quinoa TaxID=63459 RepID=A0A803MW00_CHEQI
MYKQFLNDYCWLLILSYVLPSFPLFAAICSVLIGVGAFGCSAIVRGLRFVGDPLSVLLQSGVGISRGGVVVAMKVAGVAVIFEVQRSAKSEARKEEARAQEFQALRQRDEDLTREIEALKQRFEEIEKLAKEQGKSGIFSIRKQPPVAQDPK